MSEPELYAFQNTKDLELFSLIVGAASLLLILIIIFVLYMLNDRITKLKRQLAQLQQKEQHSFYNPTIQPDEELGKRGFSMYNGQTPARPVQPVNSEPHFASFD